MATVVLVRPGCTDFDTQKRIQGSLDLPLNEKGQSLLPKIVALLQPLPIEAVFTGPCDPCLTTARTIAESLGVPLKEIDGLGNLNQGLWQGMSMDEARRKFPKVFKQWDEAPETVCPPEGETISQCHDRLLTALKKPFKKYETFAIVASEPLASLLSFILRGDAPEDLSESMFRDSDDPHLEFIESNGLSQSDLNYEPTQG